MTSEPFFFFAAIIGLQIFFWACVVQFSFIVFFRKYSNSIDRTITTSDVLLCKCFFHNVACANFCYALLGLCKFSFLQILPLPPPPPPPTRSTGPSLKLLTICILV